MIALKAETRTQGRSGRSSVLRGVGMWGLCGRGCKEAALGLEGERCKGDAGDKPKPNLPKDEGRVWEDLPNTHYVLDAVLCRDYFIYPPGLLHELSNVVTSILRVRKLRQRIGDLYKVPQLGGRGPARFRCPDSQPLRTRSTGGPVQLNPGEGSPNPRPVVVVLIRKNHIVLTFLYFPPATITSCGRYPKV